MIMTLIVIYFNFQAVKDMEKKKESKYIYHRVFEKQKESNPTHQPRNQADQDNQKWH